MWRTGARLLVAGVIAVASCTRPRTEIVAVVDSEVAWGPDQRVQSVSVEVRRGGARGAVRVARTIVLGGGPGQAQLPLSVGLVPGDDGLDELVWIEVRGCATTSGCATGAAVVVQRALARYVEEQTLELPLLLASACVGATCAATERCEPVMGMRTCVAASTARVRSFPGRVEPLVGDASAGMDTPGIGTPDVGTPAPDTGTPDIGTPAPDAGTPDVGTPAPDVGTPAPDVGTPVPDVGTPDTGTPRADAGTPDVGTPVPDAGTVTCEPGLTACGSACRNLAIDSSSCGACYRACDLTNATSACQASMCRVVTCFSGYTDCNGVAADGCEADLRTSIAHCGACGRACAAPAGGAATCSGGACGQSCPSGQSVCAGACTNLMTDAANCGTCGSACTATQACVAGACMSRCSAGMQYIPAGMFLMGSTLEGPVHGVRLSAFCLDATEVTVTAYRRCPGCTAPATTSYCNWGVSGRDDHPINCVDWSQSRAYCQWQGGDLPTEAQWEYVRRGVSGRLFPWGNDAPSTQLCWNRFPTPASTCAVGSYPAGEFGLFDLEGNVSEWLADWLGPYSGTPDSYVLNPIGPASGTLRAVRGFTWSQMRTSDSAELMRASQRNGREPTVPDNLLGFRCAGVAR
ncbi:MAG: Protein kinase [Myxococcaceae bacterium]|nr:Protein kinase [Myxococcaceae bacterium]